MVANHNPVLECGNTIVNTKPDIKFQFVNIRKFRDWEEK